MFRPALLLALGLLTFADRLFAQGHDGSPAALFSWTGEREALEELPDMATDRPDFTEASSTVGLGVTQIELGYTLTGTDGVTTHTWGEFLVRQGVYANWLELRFGVSPISETGATRNSGIEDLYLGTKIALTTQERFLPEMAIVPQMTFPAGSEGFTADRVLPGANWLYSWEVTERTTFAGSTQFNRAVDDLLIPYDEWAQSLTVGHSLAEDWGCYCEWYALIPADAENASTAHTINAGLTFAASDDAQLDVRAGKGLSEASDDYFLGTGLSIRFR